MAGDHDGITLSASNLARTYGTHRALTDLSLELRQGEILGLLGPNGAGKSTAMQLLTGNLAPTAGRVTICGVDLEAAPREAKARLGYLPEIPPLYPDFTVDEYLTFAARLHRLTRAEIGSRLERVKARCGLSEVGGRRIGSLSKGYQQRVGIAQAIVHEPALIVLDEPTVGLDPNQAREMRKLIRELGTGHSMLLSTHTLAEVEAVCDRVHILNRGRTVYTGGIRDLQAGGGQPVLELRLRHPPAAEALLAIPHVVAVEADGDGVFRIRHPADADPTDALLQAAVANDWGLDRLTPVPASLEQMFARLTEDAQPPTQGEPPP